MAKHTMKVKGKEIGPAEVYAPPHTMDGQPKRTLPPTPRLKLVQKQ
jgi:hypothetical protein